MREGILVEVGDEEALARAVRRMRELGYREMEAFTPFASEEVARAMALPRGPLSRATLLGALGGGGLAYLIMWWTNVVDYPLNVGGRRLHAWPAFLPITFESAVLVGGLAVFFGFLLACGLPRPWTPLFEVPAFRRATSHAFLLAVSARDPLFDRERTPRELEPFAPISFARFPASEEP